MLMRGPHIEHNMKTPKDSYHFSIQKLGEQIDGSYEHLERYFDHIGFRPSFVGRLKF